MKALGFSATSDFVQVTSSSITRPLAFWARPEESARSPARGSGTVPQLPRPQKAQRGCGEPLPTPLTHLDDILDSNDVASVAQPHGLPRGQPLVALVQLLRDRSPLQEGAQHKFPFPAPSLSPPLRPPHADAVPGGRRHRAQLTSLKSVSSM